MFSLVLTHSTTVLFDGIKPTQPRFQKGTIQVASLVLLSLKFELKTGLIGDLDFVRSLKEIIFIKLHNDIRCL
jgi:hypothetical protein